MANPVFSNSPVFGEDKRRGGGTVYAQSSTTYSTVDAATLDDLYAAPAATTRETGRLTYDDVIMKTGGLLALLVVVGAATWALAPGLWIAGAVVGLVLGLVNAFKREPSPVLITLYTVAQGVFLGGISAFYEAAYRGIVSQAVLGTVAVAASALFVFKSGKVRVTPKFTRWLVLAMVGYLVFSLLNVVLMIAGVGGGDFGPLRNGGLGILVGLFAVGLAAASFIVDFDAIKRGVEGGAPRKMAWAAAFGLIVTLVWLYLEILRILAIFRN
ncbi:Bax inhibitor-1/YccA family protein [Cellulomonas uda]|uniref:Membrane protein n=1 Tax=Cellulomonas uda TaxID=1714 RepID=A0A4Y3KHJ0_CELUD|nr:Bax inhibitor-1/YccA family protein [Cellulomonas uda]NII67456.1 putative YccA/Bax inhibitor family protein [Cellulomonas uda]GEA82410.1 membrane protein [Cellulomonas uda]